MGYYDNVNPDLLNLASINAKTVLEIGCGAGSFARAYLQKNPTAHYVGVEYVASEADQAKPHLNEVICANIEEDQTFAKIDKALDGRGVDLLIIGDVLEHLLDPTSVMTRLKDRMSDTARAEICVPNIAHWSILMRLLRGDWTYEDNGLLDRTHFRFFTKSTMAKMFEDAGWHIRSTRPRTFKFEEGKKHALAFAKVAKELNFDPQVAAENMMPLQWVFSLSSSPVSKPVPIKAIGIGTKIDALSKIRLVQPLSALSSVGEYKVSLTVGSYTDIPSTQPGVFLTYRLHPEHQARRDEIDKKCKEGWLFVHDVDDHPAYLKGQVANDFWSIKAAHAVTVSTPALLEVCKKWNDNVFLVENQNTKTSDPTTVSKQLGPKPSVFFGALNREEDWKEQCADGVNYIRQNPDLVSCVVVHEPSLYNDLKADADITFQKTQTYENFIALLEKSDIAFLPLKENEFNLCKSDLKVIECLAHGVVPICSEFAANQTSVPNEFLCVARSKQDWGLLLKQLVSDPEKLAKLKQRGFEYVRRNRMWANNSESLDSLYKDLIRRQPELETQRLARLTR